jgi:hypothetical protein
MYLCISVRSLFIVLAPNALPATPLTTLERDSIEQKTQCWWQPKQLARGDVPVANCVHAHLVWLEATMGFYSWWWPVNVIDNRWMW